MAHALRVDAHQHFWRYDAVRVRLDRRLDGALRRDFLPADASAEMRAAGIDAVRRRPGAADARRNALAARSRGASTRSLPASSDGSICSGRRGRPARSASRRIRSSSASATSSRAKPDGFLRAACVSSRRRAPRARTASPTTSSSTRASCRPPSASRGASRASASCSIIWASRISGQALSASGGAISIGSPRFPTYAASCRGW